MKKNLLFRAIAMLIVSVTLLPIVSRASFAESLDYDYSRPAAPSVTLTACDILEDTLGYTLSDGEKKYLSLYSDFSLSYASGIPTSYLTTVYDEEERTLSVTAYEYTYVAKNGVTVRWIPGSISLRGNELAPVPSGEAYKADFTDVSIGDDNSVLVKYKSEFKVDRESVNSFLNLAYKDSIALKKLIAEKEAEYNSKKAEYDSNIEKYHEYLEALSEYESELVIYREYISAKRIYDEAYADYQTYLSELEDYNTKKLEYEEYLRALEKYNADYAKYSEYLDFLDRYQNEIAAYEEYERKITLVREQLAVIDAAKTNVTSLKRSIYSAIMGDTVTSVIANKDVITSELVKADGPVVDLAGKSTEKLRVLMTDYFAITTESGKYSYYVAHYEEFRDNFSDLLRALDKLYLVKRVRAVLIAQEKQEKYLILLAQLYCMVNALSDSPVSNYDGTLYFDSNYIIGKGYKDQKTPKAILGSIYISDNGNAEPVDGGYPSPVSKPEYTPIDEPVKPDPIKEPIAPEEVLDPGTPPNEVEKPKAPDEISDPGDPPTPYVHPEGADTIIELFDSGVLQEREELTGDITLEQELTVNKKFYGATVVSVFYFDTDGTLLYRTEVESGTFADYVGSVPEKPEDDSATYSFLSWVDSDGIEHDLSCVETDLHLYPKFSKELKQYDVTWSVDGREVTEKVTWGTVPAYGMTPEKPSGKSTYFVFSGWDKELVPVSGNVKYTATFKEYYYVPFEHGGGAEISVNNEIYTAECHTGSIEKINISELIKMAAGNGGISVATVNGTATFSYSDTLLMKNAGVHYVKISSAQRGLAGYTYTVSLFDDTAELLDTSVKAVLTVPSALGDLSHMSLYYMDGEERVSVRYSDNDTEISFTARVNKQYYSSLQYSVSVIPSELVSISVSELSVSPGRKIKISVDVPIGVTLKSLYYLDESGARVSIEPGYLVMPMYDLRIGCDAAYREFTVKFVSDGKVISSRVYKYGAEVEVPDDPKKASDDSYDYEFSGWSSEIVTVTEDVTYVAEYSKTPIEIKNDDGGLKITPSVMRLLLIGGVGISIACLGFLPSFLLALVLFIRHKSLKKTRKD